MSDRQRGRRRLAGAATALALTGGLLASGPGTATAAQAAPSLTIPSIVATPTLSPVPRTEWCTRPLSRLELYRSSSRFDPPSSLTLLNETQPVDLNTFTLSAVPFTDVSRVLWYRSLLWLAIAAVDFHENGRPDLAEQMAVPLIRAAQEFPDPGSATPELTAISNAIGWDEGTAFRRAEALLCLSEYTGVDRIRGLLRMHADALVDPNRYKGPPQRQVHNHGMLANLILLDLARRLDDPTYRQIAINRLINDSSQVFSSAGWAFEGSTMYQSVNIAGWQDVTQELNARGFTAEANAISNRLDRGREIVAHLVGPTGQLAAIGNTRLGDSVLRPDPNAARPLAFVDSEGGIASGRWSWTDPTTTWWTAVNQPRTGAHGHDDNTSLTWQTLGVPTLIDVGQYDYDDNSPITQWMSRGLAHNRALPAKVTANEAKVRTLTMKRVRSVDTVVMDSTDKGVQLRRTAIIDNKRHTFEVTDSATERLTQYWHLAPGWAHTGTEGNSATFVGPEGRVLEVQTSPGAALSVVQPSLNPIVGLAAIGFQQVASAPEIRVTGDKSITTTFHSYLSAAAVKELPPLTVSATPGNKRAQVTWAWPTPRAPKLTDKQKARAKKRGDASPTPPPTLDKATSKAIRPVTGYRLQLRHPLFGWLTVNEDNGSPTKMTAVRRKLVNGASYQLRVAALTKSGQGDYSAPVTVVPLAPPAAPTDAIVSGKPRSPVVSWTAPAETGGAVIRGYEVTIGNTVTKAKQTQIPLKKLTPGTFQMQVAAVNKAGAGKTLRITVKVAKNGRVTLG